MTPLKLPVALPMWAVAELRISRAELEVILGQPHCSDAGPLGALTQEEDFWAFQLPSGQRIAIELQVATRSAVFYSDPPWLNQLVVALGFSPSDQRFTVYPQPLLRSHGL